MSIIYQPKLIIPSARKTARRFLIFCAIIAVLAPVIANHLPLMVSFQGNRIYPVFDSNNFEDVTVNGKIIRIEYENVPWDTMQVATILYPLIRYSPGKSDFTDAGYTGPFDLQTTYKNGSEKKLSASERHWLGTGKRGDDVMAAVIHGTRTSLAVAVFSMLIAGVIGIFLGSIAGFIGDNGAQISRGGLLFAIPALLPAYFYGKTISERVLDSGTGFILSFAIFIVVAAAVLFVAVKLGSYITRGINVLKKKVVIPTDAIIIKLIELISSLPTLILILAIAAIAKPSIQNLIWIIGLTSWTEIARLTRAEVFRIRELDYISSAKSLGIPVRKIILTHILPNALTPVFTAIAFGAGAAILAESGLSFLGIGVPANVATWGKLIAEGRQNFDAWWLVLFPGLMISATVMAFYTIGKRK